MGNKHYGTVGSLLDVVKRAYLDNVAPGLKLTLSTGVIILHTMNAFRFLRTRAQALRYVHPSWVFGSLFASQLENVSGLITGRLAGQTR